MSHDCNKIGPLDSKKGIYLLTRSFGLTRDAVIYTQMASAASPELLITITSVYRQIDLTYPCDRYVLLILTHMMGEEVSASTFANRDDPHPIIRPGTKSPSSTNAEDNPSFDMSSDDEVSQGDSNHGLGSPETGKPSDQRKGLRGAWHKRTQSLQDRFMDKSVFPLHPEIRLFQVQEWV